MIPETEVYKKQSYLLGVCSLTTTFSGRSSKAVLVSMYDTEEDTPLLSTAKTKTKNPRLKKNP